MKFVCFSTYSFNDTFHLGNPVNILNKCRVFQKSLLESLSSYSNLEKIQHVKNIIFKVFIERL